MKNSIASLVLVITVFTSSFAQEKVSKFGTYEGYSSEQFDGWKRFSNYVEMRDGVKIAVDIVRPTKNGEVHTGKLPLVWAFNRYGRAYLRNGQALSYVDVRPEMQELVKHGYIVAMADVRGSGASYGVDQGIFSDNEIKDSYEIMEWFANQSWCDGNLGMYGQSYLGIAQFTAASTKHPALKAVFPSLAAFDLYDLIYTGGIYRKGFMDQWGALTINLDTNVELPKTDEDTDGSMYKEARAMHKDNFPVAEKMGQFPWRSSWSTPEATFNSPIQYVKEVNESKIPVYQWAGWLDIYSKDALIWWANMKNTQRLTMGPWEHITYNREIATDRNRLIMVEQHRWFDRWLKGVKNGIESEPEINYTTVVSPGEFEWNSTNTWPPKGTKNVDYYVNSNRQLSTSKPSKSNSTFKGKADFSATMTKNSRWLNAAGGGAIDLSILEQNNKKGIVITSEAMAEDVTITGHPVLEFEISADVEDLDLHVYIHEIHTDGSPEFVTEGALRVSHAKEANPPYKNFKLPYYVHEESALMPLSGKTRKVRMDLLPLSNVFNKGNQIAVIINFSDRDNSDNVTYEVAPTVTFQNMKVTLPVDKK